MQHGTEWRAVPHAAWYCMESHTTCSMVVNGEPSHIQHGTPWSVSISACRLPLLAVPHCWYVVPLCMWYGSPCSPRLQVVRLSMQYHAAGGTALHAVPCCRWYSSPCSPRLQVVQLHAVPGCRWYGSPCCTMLQVVQLHAVPGCRWYGSVIKKNTHVDNPLWKGPFNFTLQRWYFFTLALWWYIILANDSLADVTVRRCSVILLSADTQLLLPADVQWV